MYFSRLEDGKCFALASMDDFYRERATAKTEKQDTSHAIYSSGGSTAAEKKGKPATDKDIEIMKTRDLQKVVKQASILLPVQERTED